MYRLIRRREKVGRRIEEKSGGSIVAVSVVVGGVEGGEGADTDVDRAPRLGLLSDAVLLPARGAALRVGNRDEDGAEGGLATCGRGRGD